MGLGWMGKYINLIYLDWGFWFFLVVILMDLVMLFDEFIVDHCGMCMVCLDVCLIDVFVVFYVLDVWWCISYLIIELKELVFEEYWVVLGY